MNRILVTVLCLEFVSLCAPAGQRQVRVTVGNPSDLARPAETVSLSWNAIRKQAPELSPANVVVIDQKRGTRIVSQSVGDEFLFQTDFEPSETKVFLLRAESSPEQGPERKVDGRFMKPRDDYAWENDRIAFRMYGPALAKEVSNGIDVWVKRVRGLVVQKWYKGDEDTGAARISYHIDHGEGADFFNVGRTLGAGGCAIWHNNKLYQPGVFSSCKTIANGPLRTVFELYYDSLNAAGKVYKETCRVSFDAGQNLNRIEVTYTRQDSGEEIGVAAGLVKRSNTTNFRNKEHRWISLWGLTNEDSVNGYLGTGVILPTTAFGGFAEDNDQYLIIGRTKSGQSLTYYAGAGWTRSGDFTRVEDWNGYLTHFSSNLRHSLKIELAPEEK